VCFAENCLIGEPEATNKPRWRKFQIQMFQKLSIGDLGFVSDLEY